MILVCLQHFIFYVLHSCLMNKNSSFRIFLSILRDSESSFVELKDLAC